MQHPRRFFFMKPGGLWSVQTSPSVPIRTHPYQSTPRGCHPLGEFCPSMHAEQGITTRFSPQRAKNQSNPAWDYILLPSFPPPLFPSCSFAILLFPWIPHSQSIFFTSLLSILDTRWLISLPVLLPLLRSVLRGGERSRGRKTQEESSGRVAVYQRGVKRNNTSVETSIRKAGISGVGRLRDRMK